MLCYKKKSKPKTNKGSFPFFQRPCPNQSLSGRRWNKSVPKTTVTQMSSPSALWLGLTLASRFSLPLNSFYNPLLSPCSSFFVVGGCSFLEIFQKMKQVDQTFWAMNKEVSRLRLPNPIPFVVSFVNYQSLNKILQFCSFYWLFWPLF